MRRLGVLLSGRGSNFEAIARNILDNGGAEYAPDEIMVTPGGQQGMFIIALSLLDPGDVTAMTVHDLAELRSSIAWEVLDAFTPRLARVYTDGERPVGVRYLDGETRFVAGW